MNNYAELVNIIYQEKYKGESITIECLISLWNDVVSTCESGYSYSIFELSDELFIRDKIEILLNSFELIEFEEHKAFKRKINEIDNRFLSISFEKINKHNENWWHNRILKFAFDPYCENVKLYFGLDIVKLEG